MSNDTASEIYLYQDGLGPRLYYKGEKMSRGPARDTDFHGYGPSIRERLASVIPVDEPIRVLDVGTGMATTTRFLLAHLSTKSLIWSLDPSEEVITQANTAFSAKDLRRIRFVKGVADRMEFDDDYFDLVVSVMAMHHIEKASKSVSEMGRVLKPAGRLVIADFSPKAHTLGFQSRHAKEDFFTSASIRDRPYAGIRNLPNKPDPLSVGPSRARTR